MVRTDLARSGGVECGCIGIPWRARLDFATSIALSELMAKNILVSLSAQQLRKAASLREKIDGLTKQLSNVLGVTSAPAGVAKPVLKQKRKMSSAARAKIAAAQRKRWAKQKRAAKKSAKS